MILSCAPCLRSLSAFASFFCDTRSVARKCGACSVRGHRVTHCPINVDDNVRCGCKKPTCGPFSAACAVCSIIGHKPDTLEALIVGRAAPRWSCSKHNTEEMQARLQPALMSTRPTIRAQKEAARGHKRALAETRPSDGKLFRTHVAQSEIIDLTGLGGAGAAAAVRTAAGVAAVAQDAGASRQEPRIMGAFVSDMGSKRSGGAAQPIPGALGAVDLDYKRVDVVASIREALRNAPKYSPDARAAQRRRMREAGLGGGGPSAPDEVLGSANPFYSVKGKDLKKAAQRYVSLPDGRELGLVKLAMSKFVGEGRVYTGVSVTCEALTCKQVCDELMDCSTSVGLKVPAVLASLRQFIVELRGPQGGGGRGVARGERVGRRGGLLRAGGAPAGGGGTGHCRMQWWRSARRFGAPRAVREGFDVPLAAGAGGGARSARARPAARSPAHHLPRCGPTDGGRRGRRLPGKVRGAGGATAPCCSCLLCDGAPSGGGG